MPLLYGRHVIVDLRDYKEKFGLLEAEDVRPLSLIAPDENTAEEIESERAALEAGRAVYEMRKGAGLTQQALAAKTGYDQAVIARIERGRMLQGPTYQTLTAIMEACGCRIRFEKTELNPPHRVGGGSGVKDGADGQKAAVHALNAKRAKG